MRRHDKGFPLGALHPRAKLTAAHVIEARRAWRNGTPITALAIQYKVSETTMGAAVKGLTWRHVESTMPKREDIIQSIVERRFWSKVDSNAGVDGCWPWLGAKNRNDSTGYGKFKYKGGVVYAHRFAYQQENGSIADGQVVRHSCDNPICCNPRHLLAGTHADNSADAIARGRHSPPPRFIADKHPMAKLTTEIVRVARDRWFAGESVSRLAKEYGVGETTMTHAVKGDTWRTLAMPGMSSEDQFQSNVFDYFNVALPKDTVAFAVPNGGSRHPIEAKKLKRTGTRAGIPDICIVHNGRALFLELKVGKNQPTAEQINMIGALTRSGAAVAVCWTFDDVKAALKSFGLKLRDVS